MLTVKPIQDKQVQKDICNLCGVEYNEAHFCYGGYVDDVLYAVCQFYLNGEYGFIDEIALVPGQSNDQILTLIGRSALSFIDFCGVHKALYLGDNTDIARSLGFKGEDGRLSMQLTAHTCG
jgi:hypothetical protein